MKSLIKLVFILAALVSTAQASSINIESIKNAKQVAYVLASGKGVGRSMFGHAYLRFIMGDTPAYSDPTLELVADPREEKQTSLFGIYLRGLGIGKNFSRAAVLEEYSVIYMDMTKIQNRDVYTYVLNLDQSKVDKITQKTIEILKEGHWGEYNFITKNCAQGVLDLLGAADIQVDGIKSLIPDKIPDILKNKKLISSEIFEEKSDSLRKKYVEENKSLLQEIVKIDPNLKIENLTSFSFGTRFYTYTGISNVYLQFDKKKQREIRLFLDQMLFTEPMIVRRVIMRNIYEGMQMYPASVINIDRNLINSSSKITKASVKIIKGKPHLVLDIKKSVDHKSPTTSTQSQYIKEIPEMSLEDGIVKLNERQIGVVNPFKDSEEEILLTKADMVWSKEKGSKFIQVFMVVDVSDEKPTEKWLAGNMIPFQNNDPRYPSCYAFTALQKRIYGRTIFAPHLPRLSAEQNLEIIKGLLSGSVVVVPGYSNAVDWINSMNTEYLRKAIFNLQMKERSNTLDMVSIKNYFNQTELNNEKMKNLMALVNQGIYFPIEFRVGPMQGHAFLITKIEENDNQFVLSGYDPNIKKYLNSMAFFDKASQSLVTAYGYDATNESFLSVKNPEEDVFYKMILTYMKKDLLLIAEKSNKFIFSRREIFKIL